MPCNRGWVGHLNGRVLIINLKEMINRIRKTIRNENLVFSIPILLTIITYSFSKTFYRKNSWKIEKYHYYNIHLLVLFPIRFTGNFLTIFTTEKNVYYQKKKKHYNVMFCVHNRKFQRHSIVYICITKT